MRTLHKFVSFIASLNTVLGKIASYCLIVIMLFLSYEDISLILRPYGPMSFLVFSLLFIWP
jgi:TRAP-type mannitol/chloroaromatic compound transport system permease small subunit